ncbi:MAG TPA: flagellar motor protein MotD [Steroidobacteraceae bacterium]|nr:flagellar motor protein MotD [Steroidobacteraceae bacterium]
MGRRKRKHEDHVNHEAWAIPYGDLITLLLAFFVVMYAISSVNAGKFRVLSDSLNAAFRGSPTTFEPVQIGERSRGTGADLTMQMMESKVEGKPRSLIETVHIDGSKSRGAGQAPYPGAGETGHAQPTSLEKADHPMAAQLSRVADELQTALQTLVDADLVAVRRHQFWLEVEVRSDILFPSGVATLSGEAYPALDALAATLVKYPNPLRVEGHTDDLPIRTKLFLSNWELSAARAASVVHRFQKAGIAPSRLSVIGFGEFRPTQPNDTAAGRNANRRVVVVILSGDGAPAPADSADAAGVADEASQANQPAALPPLASGSSDQTDSSRASETPSVLPVPGSGGVGTETAPLPVTVGTGGGNPTRE